MSPASAGLAAAARPRVRRAAGRRGRLAFLVAQRQAMMIDRPTLLIRIVALSVLLTVLSIADHPLPAIGLAIPAVVMCVIRAPDRNKVSRLLRAQASFGQASLPPAIRRRRRVTLAWLDVLSAQLAVGAASWLTAGVDLRTRVGALGAALVLLSVVLARACLQPRWYRRERGPHLVTNALRQGAGPVAVLIAGAIALPAPWTNDERVVVALMTLTIFSVTMLTRDQDLTMVHLVELIRNEAQDGRQIVLDETHGALSTTLRLLEQRAREERERSPRLYELAVSANSRLRETLTLADPVRESATGPECLRAVVTTLVLAVGARGEFRTELVQLAGRDRDLVRLVLNELVSAALSGGAGVVDVVVRLTWGVLTVEVTDDGQEVADPLDWLRRRLAAAQGSLETWPAPGRRTTCAQWPAAAGTS